MNTFYGAASITTPLTHFVTDPLTVSLTLAH